jgi:hypothetical protein
VGSGSGSARGGRGRAVLGIAVTEAPPPVAGGVSFRSSPRFRGSPPITRVISDP